MRTLTQSLRDLLLLALVTLPPVAQSYSYLPPLATSLQIREGSFEAVGEEEKNPTNYRLDPQIYDSSFCHRKPPSVLHPRFQRDT